MLSKVQFLPIKLQYVTARYQIVHLLLVAVGMIKERAIKENVQAKRHRTNIHFSFHLWTEKE